MGFKNLEKRRQRTTTVADLAERLGRKPTPQEASDLLWARTPDERVTAMRRGELTLNQLTEWTRTAPDEVPRAADGEFEWIAVTTPEFCD